MRNAEALVHPAFDTKNNTPLSNLYVLMLQRLGIESEKIRDHERHDVRVIDGVVATDEHETPENNF